MVGLRLAAAMVFALVLGAGYAAAAPPSPPPLEAYGELPDLEDLALSPDGTKLGMVARIEGARRLLMIDRAGKLLTHADVGTAKFRGLFWAGNGHVIALISNTQSLGPGFTTSQVELYGAIALSVHGGKPKMVFDSNPSLVGAVFGHYGTRHVGGRWFAYFGAIELRKATGMSGYEFDHGRPALYAWDLDKASARRIARSAAEGHSRTWLIDANGEVAASLDISTENGRWEITNAEAKTIASGTDPTGDIGMIALGKDGTSVVYSTEDNATGVVDWMEVPLAGGEAKPFLADADIERIYVDPASGRLMGYLPRGTAKQPVLFDPAQQAVLRRVYRAFPKKDVAIVDWTPDFQFFLVNTSGNGDSGSYYLVDIAQRKADIVGEERPRIPPEQVGPISTFAYTASDGLAMDGILTLPPRREPKNLPVVILPHGGPTSHDIETFDWWAQAIASRGYAVFQPNFRGSTNRDDAFRRAGYGQWGRKMQTDLSDGLAELAKQGIVDAKRACIVGASYGGYAALAGVTLQQGIYRCAVAVAPVSDLSTMYNDDLSETNRSRMTRASLRESLGDPKAFDAVSPRRSAARADAPILLIHGKDDTVVPFKHSDAMASALRGAGKPFELVVLREEDHWLTRGATRLKMLEETMRFLKAHNPAD